MEEDCLSKFSVEFSFFEFSFQKETCQVQIPDAVYTENLDSEPTHDNLQIKSQEDKRNSLLILLINSSIQDNFIIEFQGDSEEEQVVLDHMDVHIIFADNVVSSIEEGKRNEMVVIFPA